MKQYLVESSCIICGHRWHHIHTYLAYRLIEIGLYCCERSWIESDFDILDTDEDIEGYVFILEES